MAAIRDAVIAVAADLSSLPEPCRESRRMGRAARCSVSGLLGYSLRISVIPWR